MPAIPGPGPSTLSARRSASVLVSLIGRDTTTEDGSGGGGLAESTKIGIGIGLICFFGLIVSWLVILRWRHSRRPMTEDEVMAQATFARWIDRIARAPAAQRARDEADRIRFDSRAARRLSGSTFSSSHSTGKRVSQQETFELALPSKAHLEEV